MKGADRKAFFEEYERMLAATTTGARQDAVGSPRFITSSRPRARFPRGAK